MRRPLVRFLLFFVAGAAVGLGIYFAFIHQGMNPVLEFSSVRDSFTDVKPAETTVVYFIRVKAYDSLQIRNAADYYIKEELVKPELAASKQRTLLLHFFVEGDTAALGTDMLDELAYTHPEVTDPSSTLMLVPSGYVMKVVYKPGAQTAATSELKRTQFYMARPGIHAKDLHS